MTFHNDWIKCNIMKYSGSKWESILMVGSLEKMMIESSVKFWYHMHESMMLHFNISDIHNDMIK